jgi:cyclase
MRGRISARLLAAVFIVGCTSCCSQAAPKSLFKVHQVAEGVYAVIAQPQRPENCNSTIILLDDGVLVVDALSTPSSARALIAQIRLLTDKPVRFVVNTHFHWDHYWGNSAFADAFPDVRIISTQRTREDMERLGLGNLLISNWSHRIPKLMEQWKAGLEKETDPAARQAMQTRIDQWSAALPEIQSLHPVLPNLTFKEQMILREKSRTVEILWLGPAHTPGDAVVYLPKEKVLISGDLLAGDTPFLDQVAPYDWIETLNRVAALDFATVIPGHGEVMRGKDRLLLWKTYLGDLMSKISEQYANGASLEEVKKQLLPWLKEKYASRFDASFDYSVEGNVQAVYRLISGGQD